MASKRARDDAGSRRGSDPSQRPAGQFLAAPRDQCVLASDRRDLYLCSRFFPVYAYLPASKIFDAIEDRADSSTRRILSLREFNRIFIAWTGRQNT